MDSNFREKCKNYGVSPVIGVILLVAIVVILAALIGIISFGFTDVLDGSSTNAAFELNEREGTITPIQVDVNQKF